MMLIGKLSPAVLPAMPAAVAAAADIPVQIDWTVLDDQLLSGFWQRHQQAAETPTTNSNCASSSSSGGGRLSTVLSGSEVPGRGSSASPSGGLLERSQLPDFADRMLVFHRWGWCAAMHLAVCMAGDLLLEIAACTCL
jgi:hypothetical protein